LAIVFSLLTKRLLSSPYALARTWWAHIEGYAEKGTVEEADAARRRLEAQTADDVEMAQREEDVVRTGAAWLVPQAIVPGRIVKFGVQMNF